MNIVCITGNLTKDPETRQTNSGKSVCSFTVAVNRRHSDAAGAQAADFFPVVAWEKLGENCEKFLRKGRKAAVTGSISTRSYEKDGVKRYVTEIIAQSVDFLSPPGETPPPHESFTQVDDPELPF